MATEAALTGHLAMHTNDAGGAITRQRGYHGRTGIHEVLVIDEVMRQLISERASQSTLMEYAVQRGFIDMRIDGIKKVVAGLTSIEEILRVSKG